MGLADPTQSAGTRWRLQGSSALRDLRQKPKQHLHRTITSIPQHHAHNVSPTPTRRSKRYHILLNADLSMALHALPTELISHIYSYLDLLLPRSIFTPRLSTDLQAHRRAVPGYVFESPQMYDPTALDLRRRPRRPHRRIRKDSGGRCCGLARPPHLNRMGWPCECTAVFDPSSSPGAVRLERK